ncbi:hypothetical protein C8Q80DRAFT_1266879 [Daedaleopsis nitida]|nr:hypothetical protein C8Q80DRAFT_1266879 [Daedaleopsis nitida]
MRGKLCKEMKASLGWSFPTYCKNVLEKYNIKPVDSARISRMRSERVFEEERRAAAKNPLLVAVGCLNDAKKSSKPSVVRQYTRQPASIGQSSSNMIPVALRSADFWYPDGNIIIKVECTYFKLLGSRLERHCEYFARAFSSRSAYSPSRPQAEGCPIHTLTGISLRDFAALLRYLELPGESLLDASKDAATSLLAAAHFLSCKVVFDIAGKQLTSPWPFEHPPTAGDPPPPSYQSALDILSLARRYGLTAPVKRALYELIANDAFWTDVAHPDRGVHIFDAELVRLHRARAGLQEK